MKRACPGLIALLLVPAVYAAEPTALFLLDAQPNVRQYAMGGVLSSLSFTDAASQPWELGYAVSPAIHLSHWPGAVKESQYNFVSAVVPGRGLGGFSVSYLNYGTGSETVEELDGTTRSIQLESNKLLSLGWGRAIGEKFYAGGALKYLSSTLADTYSANAALGDLGLVYRSLDDKYTFGAAVVNFGGKLKYYETQEPVPTQIKLGHTRKLRPAPGQKVVLGLGYATSAAEKNYSAGAEWFPNIPFVSVRAGVNKNEEGATFAGGLGLNWGNFALDFGYDLSSQKVEEEQSPLRFALNWTFGPSGQYAAAEKYLARGMKKKAMALWGDVRPSEPRYAQAREAIRQYANPPELYAEARLVDANGDGTLSPGETGEIVVTVGNRGRGYAASPKCVVSLPGAIPARFEKLLFTAAPKKSVPPPAEIAQAAPSQYKSLDDLAPQDPGASPDASMKLLEGNLPELPEAEVPPAGTDQAAAAAAPAPTGGFKVLPDAEGSVAPGLRVGAYNGQLSGLEPGQTAVVKVPVTASAESERSSLEFTIQVEDARGFTAESVLFAVTLKGFTPPQLALARYTFKEDGTGNSEGNGNGIIERGERVELTGYVVNAGLTEARRATWAVEGGQGIKISLPSERDLGVLRPGQFRKVVFNFGLPADYSGGNQLPVVLNISEERLRFGRQQQLKLALGSFYRDPIEPVFPDLETSAALAAVPALPGPVSDAQAQTVIRQIADTPPELEFEKQVLKDGDLNGNGVYEPGETVKIKVVIRNTGGQAAKNVRVAIFGDETAAALLGGHSAGDIPPGGSRAVLLQAQVPNSVPRKESSFSIKVTEARGFSASTVAETRLAFQPKETKIIKQLAGLLPVPRDNSGKRPNAAAVVVGIGGYKNFSALNYAAADARLAAQYLGGVMGVPEENIKLAVDGDATKTTIVDKWADWLASKPGLDTIIFYFAGHGLPDPANPKEGDTFLVPADGDPEARGTLINLRDLIARLEGSTAKNVLVLLDACYSGLKGSRGLMAGPLFRQQKAVVLSGANNGQASFEFEKAGHGYFTYYMLLGLKGQADAAPYGNSDGAVTDSELCAYVKASMFEATSGRQTPVCSNEGKLEMGRYR